MTSPHEADQRNATAKKIRSTADGHGPPPAATPRVAGGSRRLTLQKIMTHAWLMCAIANCRVTTRLTTFVPKWATPVAKSLDMFGARQTTPAGALNVNPARWRARGTGRRTDAVGNQLYVDPRDFIHGWRSIRMLGFSGSRKCAHLLIGNSIPTTEHGGRTSAERWRLGCGSEIGQARSSWPT